MPKVRTVEEKIARVEQFAQVHFWKNGLNVRSDKEEMPQYGYFSAAPASWTLAEWRRNRFAKTFPGYDVKVYMRGGDGKLTEAAGNMKLSTIRTGR